MSNEYLTKIKDFERPISNSLKLEKRRIIATQVIFDLPLLPQDTFDTLYDLLNQNSKSLISKTSHEGQIFIRKFNEQSLHYVLTKNIYCKELELAVFIGDSLFKLNFELLGHKYCSTTIAYTESWRFSTCLSRKTHWQKIRNHKKLARNKALELKEGFYRQAQIS